LVVPLRLRELAILTVARLNGGGFEFAAHQKIGREAGVTESQIAALAAFETSPVFTERERAVMAYAAEVTQYIKVQDTTWAVVASFLSNRELIELVLNVAWYNQTARVTTPLQLQGG
jgi:AhpD family alkylhydroperoxidase